MALPRLRHLLLKCCFPVAVLIAIILAVLDASTPTVVGQKEVTVTVYVTVVRTLLVQVPVTLFLTLTSIVTSVVTSVTTEISISSATVTQWNTVTSIVTTFGVFGPLPGTIFGSFSDLALTGGGVSVGAAATAASLKLLSRGRSPPTGKPKGMTETGATDIDSLVQLTMAEAGEDDDSTRRGLIEEMQQAARQKTRTCPYCHRRMP